MANPILPGATIGIFGSGQLGRMIALAAKKMGYRIHTFSQASDSPTGQVADYECAASYDDVSAVQTFISNTDVVTFEFENINAEVADIATSLGVPVHPSGRVLRTAQNRINEKTTLHKAGLPITPFVPIIIEADLVSASSQLGYPIVLKTAASGYDGKGQAVVNDNDELRAAWREMDHQPVVAESYVHFDKELSVVAARGTTGAIADYGVIENIHRNHILDLSISPALIPAETAQEARRLTKCVLESLDVVGTLCVEFFLCADSELFINEIAPRPHNSGHLTIEAAQTSQFDQHVRAICGLPLGSTVQAKPAAMVNLLGYLWEDGTPDWLAALAYPDVKLHLYGKQEARPGRKMGHLTAVASETSAAKEAVLAARQALMGCQPVDCSPAEGSASTRTPVQAHLYGAV